jgi:hypothetical protein
MVRLGNLSQNNIGIQAGIRLDRQRTFSLYHRELKIWVVLHLELLSDVARCTRREKAEAAGETSHKIEWVSVNEPHVVDYYLCKRFGNQALCPRTVLGA